MMYAVALDDIAELVDPIPVDTPPSDV